MNNTIEVPVKVRVRKDFSVVVKEMENGCWIRREMSYVKGQWLNGWFKIVGRRYMFWTRDFYLIPYRFDRVVPFKLNSNFRKHLNSDQQVIFFPFF